MPKDGSDLAASKKETLFQRKPKFFNKEDTTDTCLCRNSDIILKLYLAL